MRAILLPFLVVLAACGPAGTAPVDAAPAATEPAPVPPPSADARLADLVADDAGRFHALLAGSAQGRTTLHAVALEAGGSVERVTADGGWPARLGVDGDGTLHAVWYARPGPAAAASEVRLATRGAAGWAAVRTLHRELAGALPGDGPLAAARAADGALRVLHATAAGGLGATEVRGMALRSRGAGGQDGVYAAWGDGSAAAEVAFVGVRLSPGMQANSDVLVRALEDGGWTEVATAFADARGFSHHPRLFRAADGTRELLWLEDADGDVVPERIYLARSADGVAWSRPEDVTPPALAGGVLWHLAGARDADGTLHLVVRHSRADRTGTAAHHLRLRDGRPVGASVLVPPDALGPGEALVAADARGRRVMAAWLRPDRSLVSRPLTEGR